MMEPFLFFINFASAIAIVAQLVERWLPKPKVAGSCPVYRSEIKVPDSGAFSYSSGLGSQRLVRWLAARSPEPKVAGSCPVPDVTVLRADAGDGGGR